MGKKYLDTKKDSLEQSILGVWKTAVEEGSGRMDGRTSEYREHRKKLESARSKRESTKIRYDNRTFKKENLVLINEKNISIRVYGFVILWECDR